VSEDTAFIVRELLTASSVPVVLDADGINAVASDIEFIEQMKAPLILTPHPGEMSRLCGLSTAEIEKDRIGVASRFATLKRVYLILKGANTLVATPDGRVFVNTTGNTGLATGGSGDTLTGILVSLLAQGIDPLSAATSAVWLHGSAADLAKERVGETALLPRDLIDELPNLFK
jgi:NAD(P)H-hydrate epimerase